MKEQNTVLDYVDSIMIVDKNLNILYASRFNPRFNNAQMNNEYGKYSSHRYFEIYPELDPQESTMIQCLKSGKIIYRENQVFNDFLGRVYQTNNITYPIIRYGEIVGVVELSKDITSVRDLNHADKRDSNRRESRNHMKSSNDCISFESIITGNNQMIENIRRAKIYALNDSPVLIYGETGTGKEMFVEAMVNANKLRKNKYIAQNCAAIPESLFESLLFGSSKGAFTGAEDKMGLFEMADGGILFLDELNSMPMHLQAKLLRVIQDKKVRPIGNAHEKHINVKIIAAMNENPVSLVKKNLLREDLFYRLSSNTIHLIPLRDRSEDIPLYIHYFIKQYNEIYNRKFKLSVNLMDMFLSYDWHGNVRELKHVIEAMVDVAEGELLTTKDLPIYLIDEMNKEYAKSKNIPMKNNIKSFKMSLQEMVDRAEMDYIMQALEFTSGNVSRAAELLQLPRQTLKYKMDKLKINIYHTK